MRVFSSKLINRDRFMSKIVIWGHWIVGLLAAAITATSIYGIIGNATSMEKSLVDITRALRIDDDTSLPSNDATAGHILIVKGNSDVSSQR
jgi:spermidine/putrescine-binding protein